MYGKFIDVGMILFIFNWSGVLVALFTCGVVMLRNLVELCVGFPSLFVGSF